jgi:hypothetical protein
MPDPVATGAANAPGASAEPQSAPPAEGANSAAALVPAAPESQAPSDPGADAGSPTASDESKRKPAAQRIEEVVAEREALRDAAEFWRSRALSGTQASPAPTPQPAQAPKPAPKLADFEHDTDRWAQAYAEWQNEVIEQRVSQGIAKAVETREAAAAESQVKAQWETRAAEYSKAHPDFIAVVSNPRLPITDAMTKVIIASEKGPELVHHLGLNPDKAVRISRLPPEQQAAALGRLEAELSTAPPRTTPPPKPTTRAPDPPTPVSAGTSPSKRYEDMSIDEYVTTRLQERASRHKRA